MKTAGFALVLVMFAGLASGQQVKWNYEKLAARASDSVDVDLDGSLLRLAAKFLSSDDPDQAMPFFFPLGAYRQVKDVTDPAADWKHRLVAAYRRDIHALHARLGADPSGAKLLGLDVPEARARWVEPGEEWNKLGYYRVFGTKLRYSAGGEEHAFDVKSLISWRGEWFVVHLSAIG